MITKDKITEIFCIADDFCKEFELETDKIGLSEKSKGCPPAGASLLLVLNSEFRIQNSKIPLLP